MQKNNILTLSRRAIPAKREIRGALLSWYRRNGRTLPWRDITRKRCSPLKSYHILVSEIMLQQTQVSRVLEKYPEFLRRFPTLSALARARQRSVVMAWQGMGYNNRAIRLHKLAKSVMSEYNGKLPRNIEALMALPGIGKYTAHAVLSSAFGYPLPVVDVNVQRVLSRIFWKMPATHSLCSEKEVWELAGELLPKGKAYGWNQALMDFGATVCTARQPECGLCPVSTLCASMTSMKRLAVKMPKREPSRNGVPNRIYRGRIVQELRNAGGAKSIPAGVLSQKVFPKFGDNDAEWWKALLGGLQRDGIVKVDGKRTLMQQRISLA